MILCLFLNLNPMNLKKNIFPDAKNLCTKRIKANLRAKSDQTSKFQRFAIPLGAKKPKTQKTKTLYNIFE